MGFCRGVRLLCFASALLRLGSQSERASGLLEATCQAGAPGHLSVIAMLRKLTEVRCGLHPVWMAYALLARRY